MSSSSFNRLVRLERLGLFLLHAYPVVHCLSPEARPGSVTGELLRANRNAMLAHFEDAPHWLRGLAAVIWPPAMIVIALVMLGLNGRHVKRRYGRSLWSQFFGQLYMAFRHGIPVNFYYVYDLHEPENAAHAAAYIHRGLLKSGGMVYKLTYRAYPGRLQRARLLSDKKAFYEFCRDRDLPTPRHVLFAKFGQILWVDAEARHLPPVDLFIKPLKRQGGTGAERWRFSEGRYHCGDKSVLDGNGLVARITELSRSEPYLVQECLANHADLADLTAGALSTLRIHTMRNGDNRVEHMVTMLRMSQVPTRIVDTQDGVAALVDPDTGRLGEMTNSSSLMPRWLDRHPCTNAATRGRQVPFWPQALALAMAAHDQLEAPIAVGWDIAITEKGPVILEANKAADIEVEQRLGGALGDQRMGELLTCHIKRAGRLDEQLRPVGEKPRATGTAAVA